MTRGPIFVVAAQSERLRPAFTSLGASEEICFVDDLTRIDEWINNRPPEIALLFNDIGFGGATFREIAHTPTIKWTHVSGSGYEYLEPILRDDLTVTNGQGLRARDLAETVLGAMIALNSGLLTYRDQQRDQLWRPQPFRPLNGQTLLVIGTGLIGTWVARYAKTLGMHVIGTNRSGRNIDPLDEVVPIENLDQVLPCADVVSLHLRHTPETDRLFDARMFELMKPGALFLNTARGAIVDEAVLIETLESGKLNGAYLDVFTTEPLIQESPLWAMNNVLITPHAADTIKDWDIKAAEFFVQNLARWRAGAPLENIVRSANKG